MGYGEKERQYAEPFANALASDSAFRKWIIEKTEFAQYAESARLLDEEMKALRSKISKNWWRSHFTEACRCLGCSGKETDLLAIFESSCGTRFALHFEVKHPGDRFKIDGFQAQGYPLRAQCWIDRPPGSIVSHGHASTVLLFSEANRRRYEKHLPHFATLITFEDVKSAFPNAAPVAVL